MCTAQFVNFAAAASGQSLTVDDFWSNPLCMQYYKNLVSFWLNHPNKLANGLQFKVLRQSGVSSSHSNQMVLCNILGAFVMWHAAAGEHRSGDAHANTHWRSTVSNLPTMSMLQPSGLSPHY